MSVEPKNMIHNTFLMKNQLYVKIERAKIGRTFPKKENIVRNEL